MTLFLDMGYIMHSTVVVKDLLILVLNSVGVGYSLRDSMRMPVLTVPSVPNFARSAAPADDLESGPNVALLSSQQSGNQ